AWTVLKTLARFPEAVRDAAESYHPHVVANALFHLAQQFHAFYHEVPVLQAEDAALRAGRIQLVAAVATVMRTGLGLLGIQVPERM
ncbi:MAG: DALR anticodon-binding domain-containing protein, partial [bacterium]